MTVLIHDVINTAFLFNYFKLSNAYEITVLLKHSVVEKGLEVYHSYKVLQLSLHVRKLITRI